MYSHTPTGIAKNFIIPSDEKLYVNKNVEVKVNDYKIDKNNYIINDGNKGIKQNKIEEERSYIVGDTLLPFIPFIDIKALLKTIRFKTTVI